MADEHAEEEYSVVAAERVPSNLSSVQDNGPSVKGQLAGRVKNPIMGIVDSRGRISSSAAVIAGSGTGTGAGAGAAVKRKEVASPRASAASRIKSNDWLGANDYDNKSYEDTSMENRTPKKARFMRNGDEHFTGVIVVISPQRTRTFGSLLTELTRLMSNSVTLPQGVRYVFSTDGERITFIDSFENDGVYVCSSSNFFKQLPYAEIASREPPHPHGSKASPANKTKSSAAQMLKASDHAAAKQFVRPRRIFVIRNEISRPRKIFRILLNRKTAISLDQVLNTISREILLDTGAVRKLYTLGGEKVSVLEDFFKTDDVFLAYGRERPKLPGSVPPNAHVLVDAALTKTEFDKLRALGAEISMPAGSRSDLSKSLPVAAESLSDVAQEFENDDAASASAAEADGEVAEYEDADDNVEADENVDGDVDVEEEAGDENVDENYEPDVDYEDEDYDGPSGAGGDVGVEAAGGKDGSAVGDYEDGEELAGN